MPKEREDVETKSSDSPEVYQQPKFMAWFEKAFPWLLVGGAALGLVLMIFLPVIFFQEKTAEQLLAQSNLRLALLYTTGGAIAAFGLLETYRKNTNDRAKANADINAALKNQEHQAEVLKEQIRQFDENAFKDRKAERRERYTKAVEQLGDEKAPIRMGGVYTLVGLVDEWLEEKSLSDDERFKEGQVIINNLCAYIRSPFTLASHYDELSEDAPSLEGIYKDKKEEFYVDKAILDSETDVRLSIIKEIHDRIQGPDKNTPGAWSDFEYDFSGSTFFYPIDLTNSYYAKPINFSGSTYQALAYFTDSIYQGGANFSRSTYQALAYFTDSIYQGGAYFSRSIYQGGAYFRGSTYQALAYFSRSIYQGGADFTGSTYQGGADFSRSTYNDVADFSGSIFYQKVYFGADGDNSSFSRFTDCAPQFYDETNYKNTLFGSPNNDFTVENGRGYPIYRNFEGLPLGCKFLTSEQKEYLADKLQEIDETNNKLLEAKYPKEKAKLSKKLRALNEELHEWRDAITTVIVEICIISDQIIPREF
ncbi:pentapeptide repeat-containing protein [Rothia dentocariosa]|uniref:pentapeptide repeat-containing protein n=1 Tax=Rothia dentocariosa TaxID=2047 RepID=UPI003A8876F2